MYELARVQFPQTFLGADRQFRYGHTHHGDVVLQFWNDTTTSLRHTNLSPTKHAFNMSHGSDVDLIAAAIGFYRRMGISEQETKETFLRAARNIMSDPDVVSHYQRYTNMTLLKHITEGRRMPRFDKVIKGWNRLTHEISCQPGIPEEVGATALYTRQDLFGNYTLLLESIEPTWIMSSAYAGLGLEPEKPTIVELAKEDIPVFAETLCTASMGEYRRDIYQLLRVTFAD